MNGIFPDKAMQSKASVDWDVLFRNYKVMHIADVL